jgi:hypothetical protein
MNEQAKNTRSKIWRTLLVFFVSLCVLTAANSCSKRPVSSASDIEFGTKLGSLKFNMTQSQIQKEIGVPNFQRDKILYYNDMGLTIALNRKGTIGSIICGSMDADPYLLSHFKAATKEGIMIGALSEDVVKVYGQPTETRNNGTMYRYDGLSADFAFKDNRVICIVLRPATTNSPKVGLY